MADVKRAAEAQNVSGNSNAAEIPNKPAPARAPTPSVRPVSGSIGPYSLLCELGSGGMGKVFLAKRSYAAGVNRIVALKVQRPEFALHPRSKEMFLEEASIAARIVHPYVCAVSDVGVVGDACYVVMDYLVGEPLSRVAERMAKQPTPNAIACTLRLIGSLCEGLHAVHEARDEEGVALNVVHRDIAPDNLFVLYDGTVRVTDFGVACTGINRSTGKAGGIVGKCAYMAPEQMRGKQVDRRSDIWSMSVVLWEMLTGCTLFRHFSDTAVVAQVLTTKVKPPSHFNPLIPKSLDNVVLRGLCQDPTARYGSARELGSDLERVLDREFGRVGAEQVGTWLDALFPGGREFRFRLVARAKELLEAQRKGAEFRPSRPLRSDDPVDRALSRLSSPNSDEEQALTFVYEPEQLAIRATPAQVGAGPEARSNVVARQNPPANQAFSPYLRVPAANDSEQPATAAARWKLPTRPELVIGFVSACAFFAGATWLRTLIWEAHGPGDSTAASNPGNPAAVADEPALRAPAEVAPAEIAPAEIAPAQPTQDRAAQRVTAPSAPNALAPKGPADSAPPNVVTSQNSSAKTNSTRAVRSANADANADASANANSANGSVYVLAASGREAYVMQEGRAYKLPRAITLPAGENTVQVRFGEDKTTSTMRVRVTPGYMSMLVVPEPTQIRPQP